MVALPLLLSLGVMTTSLTSMCQKQELIGKNSSKPKVNTAGISGNSVRVSVKVRCESRFYCQLGRRRIHFLRKSKSFNVFKEISCMFFWSFIKGLLKLKFVFWFNGLHWGTGTTWIVSSRPVPKSLVFSTTIYVLASEFKIMSFYSICYRAAES